MVLPAVRAQASRRSAAIICLALATLLLSVLVPIRAHAAINPAIAVTNLQLTKVDALENPQDGQLVAGSSLALLTYEWDARAASPQVVAGDAFSVTLPDELQFKVRTTFPISFDFGGGAEEIGTCVVETSVMTCTFNDTMETRIREGFTEVFGTGKVQLSVVKGTNSETVDVVVNGAETVSVDLPGTGGIRVNTASYGSTALSKGATGMSEASKGVTWIIGFDATKLAAAHTAAGSPMTVDGATSQTMTMKDTIGPGQLCPAPAGVVLTRYNSALVPDPAAHRLRLDTGAPGATTTGAGTFEITFSCGTPTVSGTPATIVVTGPFAPDTTYQISYTTAADTASGYAVPGFTYENRVSVEAADRTVLATKGFVESAGVTVSLQPGYGTFRLTKLVEGAAVDASAAFSVTVDYTLPSGKTTADFPDWTPPGTLNASGTGGTAALDVSIGKPTLFTGPSPSTTFPEGTVVTLSEGAPSVPVPTGYAWGTPVFKVGNEVTNTLTIGNGAVTGVQLTNPITAVFGSFEITKTVQGDDAVAHAAKTFVFDYSCELPEGTGESPQTGTVEVTGDGLEAGAGPQLPVGSTCTVSERSTSASVDGYDVVTPAAQTVTIERDTTKPLAFVNTYSRHTGAFSVVKSVTGAEVGDQVFTFTYECTDGSKGSLEVRADGEAVTGPQLPLGTQCTVTEDTSSAQVPGHDLTAPDDQPVSIEHAGITEELSFVNEYAPSATPEPSASPEPSGDPTTPASVTAAPSAAANPGAAPSAGGPALARTGASIAVPVLVALAAIIGGVVLMRRRKQ